MDAQAQRKPAPPPVQADWAVFLDVDGTLLEIADRPEAVAVDAGLIETLERLERRLGGALALVSGRGLADLDRLFAPMVLPAAGQHGAERRDAVGRVHRDPEARRRLHGARDRLQAFAKAHRGVVLEDKGLSLAVHFRQAPDARDAIRELTERLADKIGLELQQGKMVTELKPPGHDKGKAIEAFMAEAPFAGRTLVFVGDDLTDEHGFGTVNRLGGYSVRVGDGPTSARWRLVRRADVLEWLAAGGEFRNHPRS